MKNSAIISIFLLASAHEASAEMVAYNCVQDGFQKVDKMTIDYDKGTVKWFTRASYQINSLDDDFLFAYQAVPGRPWVNALMFERETGKFWQTSVSAVLCADKDCSARIGEAAIATGVCEDRNS